MHGHPVLTGLFVEEKIYRRRIKTQRAKIPQDDSTGKGICFPAWRPEFDPRPQNIPLTARGGHSVHPAGLTGACEPFFRCWEPNAGLFQEQQVLLTTETPSSNILIKMAFKNSFIFNQRGRNNLQYYDFKFILAWELDIYPRKLIGQWTHLSHYRGLLYASFVFKF